MKYRELQALTLHLNNLNPNNKISKGKSGSKKNITLYNHFLTNTKNSLDDESHLLDNPLVRYRYKNELLTQLASSLYFGYDQLSNYQKARVRSFQYLSVGQDLLARGDKITAVLIFEEVLKTSKKHDILDIQVIALRELRTQYCLFLSNNKKYERYQGEFLEKSELLNIKNQIELIFENIGIIILKNYSIRNDLKIEEYESKLKQIKEDKKVFSSYYATYYLFESMYYIYLLKKDLQGRKKVIRAALEYFSTKSNITNVGLYTYRVKEGLCLLSETKYEKAIQKLIECKKLLSGKKLISWHNIQRYLLLSYLAKQNYDDAYRIFARVTSINKYKSMSNAFREPWYLKEAFIHFLIRTGKINPQDFPDIQLRMFRLNRFLNEVPVYSKDKKGINITINIIQILFLLSDKKYDTVIDKLNSLKQYNHRYLRKSQYIRSNCFIKMLLTIPLGHFNKKLVQTRADKYYQKLLLNPMDYSEQSLNIEIIPYERLWEEVLSILE